MLAKRRDNTTVQKGRLLASLPTITLATSVLAAPIAAAQTTSHTFQAVSIRKAAPVWGISSDAAGGPTSMNVLPDGRFEARRVSLEDLARVAYGFEELDPRRGVVDMPFFWAGRERFDVTAVGDGDWTAPPPGESVPRELRTMLRAMLDERFKLEARIETRKVRVFALRLSNASGEPGPWLRRATSPCLGPYSEPSPGDANTPRCPFRLERNRIEAGSVTMAEVARIISRISGFADRPIIDDTGLEGRFDLVLAIGLDNRGNGPLTDPRELDERLFDASRMWAERRPIAIREAMKSQLNLDLHNAKLPIPTLIIKDATSPSED